MNTNADSIEINFKGRGGHGSMPQQSIDPVLIASKFVVDVQSVVSREKDPLDGGVVTIGAIQRRQRRQHHPGPRRRDGHHP